jgi:transposase InsO family protein
MVERLRREEGVGAVARALALSTTTVRRWWRHYQAEGSGGLVDRSSRPHPSPRRLPHYRRRQLARRRHQRQSSLQIAAALGLPLPTVVHVQRQLGLARLTVLDPHPPVHRYERRVPGALLHRDIKKLGRIGRVGHRIHGDRRTRMRGIGWEYRHLAIDDATRLAYAALFPDETAVSTAAFLRLAAAWFAAQGIRWRALMTDNGSGYRSRRFQAARRQLQIRQIWTRPDRPQTNGKAERVIRTCLARWAYAAADHSSQPRAAMLLEWLRDYKTERPHTALGFRTPAQRLADRR